MFVLDASVVAKWFKLEDDRDKAIKIREEFVNGRCDIVVPELLLIELSNLFRYSKVFQLEDIEQALESLRDLEINIVVPTFEIIIEATRLSFQYEISVYDGLYIATAGYIGYRFITADEKLYRKVKEIEFIELLKDIKL